MPDRSWSTSLTAYRWAFAAAVFLLAAGIVFLMVGEWAGAAADLVAGILWFAFVLPAMRRRRRGSRGARRA